MGGIAEEEADGVKMMPKLSGGPYEGQNGNEVFQELTYFDILSQ